MYVDQNELDAWARGMEAANANVTRADAMLQRGEVDQARDYLNRVQEANWYLLQKMLRGGADRPVRLQSSAEVPVELLDTPATRRLLALLRQAQEAGAAVDRERGWTQDGEPCGWAEAVARLAFPLALEVEGPQGRGTGR